MGCYIGVAKSNGSPVRELEMDKYSGSREFLSALGDCEQLGEEWEMLRPKSFDAAVASVASLEINEELYAEMLESLRGNPDHWLQVSY